MSKRKRRIPAYDREPFFRIGQELFVDVLYNYNQPHTIDMAELESFITSAGPMALIVGRRLTLREARLLLESRTDTDDEMYARLVPDKGRWRSKKAAKRL